MKQAKRRMRLDRLLSQATGLSRKQAGIEIRKQRVRVEGELVRDPARQVDAGTGVSWCDQPVSVPGGLYLMLYKPAGVVCARSDAMHATVLDLLPPELAQRVHIVGRLDKDSTGLLLLTDDGDWSHRITSPRRGCPKSYRAELAQPLAPDAAQRFARGILLRNEKRPTKPARLDRIGERIARVTLHEGRYHQVRRMFAALGNHVTGLHREAIGGLRLDAGMQPGQWRELSELEREGLFT